MFSLRLRLFQYFVEAGAIAVRRVRKEDMRHVAKATGATLVLPQLFFFFNIKSIRTKLQKLTYDCETSDHI